MRNIINIFTFAALFGIRKDCQHFENQKSGKMKKLLLIVTAMVITINAHAQFEAGTLSIQPKIGGTGSLLTNTPNINSNETGLKKQLDASPTGGSFTGVELEYMMTDKLGLAAGVNFSQQGTGWKDTEYTLNNVNYKVEDTKLQLSYINVPVIANYYVVKGLALKTGVQFGFMTSANLKTSVSVSGNNMNQTLSTDEKVKEGLNKFDIAIPVGISYEFKVPFVIEMRYNIGLLKVNKEKGEGFEDSRNGSLSLTLGYKFKL